MSYSTVGIVTGANKGIGNAIVRQLALQHTRGATSAGRFLIYLTARDKMRGEAALAALHADEALLSARVLGRDGGLTDVRFRQLDITDGKSIERFVGDLRGELGEGGVVDFLVNNAGIAMDGFDDNVVRTTIGCNYHGTLTLTRALLPLMKPKGRIVNMASTAGTLTKFSPQLATRFRSATSVSEVTALMDEFADAVHRGKQEDEGWPSAAYAVSKAGEIAMTRALAKELEEMQKEGKAGCAKGVEVIAVCPGWVVTDMTKGRGHKLPDEGAETPVMLALKGSGGRSGTFWQDLKVLEW